MVNGGKKLRLKGEPHFGGILMVWLGAMILLWGLLHIHDPVTTVESRGGWIGPGYPQVTSPTAAS